MKLRKLTTLTTIAFAVLLAGCSGGGGSSDTIEPGKLANLLTDVITLTEYHIQPDTVYGTSSEYNSNSLTVSESRRNGEAIGLTVLEGAVIVLDGNAQAVRANYTNSITSSYRTVITACGALHVGYLCSQTNYNDDLIVLHLFDDLADFGVDEFGNNQPGKFAFGVSTTCSKINSNQQCTKDLVFTPEADSFLVVGTEFTLKDNRSALNDNRSALNGRSIQVNYVTDELLQAVEQMLVR